MRKFVIERDIPGAGAMTDDEAGTAARTSNEALAQLAPHVQWQQSYAAGDRVFCVYLADDESYIHKHSELSGTPLTAIHEVGRVMDPGSDRLGGAG